ncbi:MAG: RHS repeat-associated core domain-containing protein, partial [Planctomycetia bacterium]
QISGPNGSLGQHGWTDQMSLSFVDADGDGSGTSQLSGRYLYGPAVDEVFAVENGTGDVLWSLTDQLGTPRDWAQRTSGGNTVIAQHIRYTAFGAIDSITDASGNPLASGLQPQASFTGQLTDPDAGLIYYRARWYDPQLGKFISDDPMGFEAGDANVSRYVGNRVANSLDSSGLQDPPIYDPSDPSDVFRESPLPWLDPKLKQPELPEVLAHIGEELWKEHGSELRHGLTTMDPDALLTTSVAAGTAAGVLLIAIEEGFLKEIPTPEFTIQTYELSDYVKISTTYQGTWKLGENENPWNFIDDSLISKYKLTIEIKIPDDDLTGVQNILRNPNIWITPVVETPFHSDPKNDPATSITGGIGFRY